MESFATAQYGIIFRGTVEGEEVTVKSVLSRLILYPLYPLHRGLKSSNRTQYGTDLPDVGVIVPRPVVIEVTIGIKLFAGKLARVIACTCLISDSTQDVVLIPYQHILVVIG